MRPSLREIFTPLFAYVLLVARILPQQGRAFAETRGTIERLLEEQGKYRRDFTPDDYDSAHFAIIAWIDELLLTSTVHANPGFFEEWEENPLQFKHYGSRTAGEEFFIKVQRLGPTQREVKEIYHLCLCLGFLGEYSQGDLELKKIRNELARDLVQQFPTPLLGRDDIQRRSDQPLTPQPYQVPSPAPTLEAVVKRKPIALYTAAALASLALLFVIISLIPSKEEEPSPKAITPPPLPPPPPPEVVREHLKFFECALFTDITVMPDGTVSLKGHVEDEGRRSEVQQVVSQITGVTKVDAGPLSVVPRPFCEVIDVVAPFQQQGPDLGDALQVKLDKGCNERYQQKEHPIIEITAGKPLQHVYVDYYTADKATVVHLFPNPKQTDNFLQGATQLVLGQPGQAFQLEISPPLGLELVTVITSSQALFNSPQLKAKPVGPEKLEAELVGPYLSNLRGALNDPANATAAAAYCFITTQ